MQRGGRSLTSDSDLTRLAAGYAHRPEDQFALDRVDLVASEAGLRTGSLVLDVGGGPGSHAGRLARRHGVNAVVVDPSPAMNRLARIAHPALPVVCGRGEKLPFRDGCADLVYFHLSIHHTRWQTALAEARRVVAAGGVVEVITLGPDHHKSSLLSRWFPRVADLDERRFPDPEAIFDELERLGGTVTHTQTVQAKRRPVRAWIDAVRARFVSTLQMLSDDEIEDGLDRLVASTPDLDVDLEYTMIWERVSARF